MPDVPSGDRRSPPRPPYAPPPLHDAASDPRGYTRTPPPRGDWSNQPTPPPFRHSGPVTPPPDQLDLPQPILITVIVLVLLAAGGLAWALVARAGDRVAALEPPLATSGEQAIVPGVGALRFGDFEVTRVRVSPERRGNFRVHAELTYRGTSPAVAGFVAAEVRDEGDTVGRLASTVPLLFEPGSAQQVELRGDDEYGLHDDVTFAVYHGLPPDDPLGRREVTDELVQEDVSVGQDGDGDFQITTSVIDHSRQQRNVHLVAEVFDGDRTVGALATTVAMRPDDAAGLLMDGVGAYTPAHDVRFRAYTVD
jgi:hypothetical protein